jgi:hypothetical protein
VTGVVGRVAEIGRQDLDARHQLGILQPRADALFDLFQAEIGGDHRRQPVDVAIIDDLEELFLRPTGRILRAEIIQHQQAHVFDLLKAFFEGRFGISVGKTQRIEHIWHGDEEGWHTQADGEIGDRGCQVRFSTTIAALQQQPARQSLGKMHGLVVSPFE